MVNILILGATGTIGFPTALALRRNSHTVFALTRSKSNFPFLITHELIPLLGDPYDPTSWISLISQNRIDIVIDVSAPNVSNMTSNIKALTATTFPHLASPAKIGYLYYSGTWVYGGGVEGHAYGVPMSDQSAIFKSSEKGLEEAGLTASPVLATVRVDADRIILSKEIREKLDVVIIRPCMVFGGKGVVPWMLVKPVVEAAEKGEKEVTVLGAESEVELGFVHKEDLADLGRKIVEKWAIATSAAYPLYNACGLHLQPRTLIKAAAKSTKYEGKIMDKNPENLLEEALLTSAKLTVGSDRARTLFDWVPKHTDFAINMDIYLAAMKAGHEQKE